MNNTNEKSNKCSMRINIKINKIRNLVKVTDILVDGSKLETNEAFKYFGRTVTKYNNCNEGLVKSCLNLIYTFVSED